MPTESGWPRTDRRSHPRIEADLAGRYIPRARGEEPVVMRGKNISCTGVYCHTNRYIAPFQKLRLSMILPLRQNGHLHNEVIQLEGITVRIEPEMEDPNVADYHVAILFKHLTREDQDVITTYVQQH